MKAQKINNNGVHKKRYSKSNLNILPSFLSNKHILSKNQKIQKNPRKNMVGTSPASNRQIRNRIERKKARLKKDNQKKKKPWKDE